MFNPHVSDFSFNNLQVLGHDAMPFAVHGPGRLPDPATFAGAFGYL